MRGRRARRKDHAQSKPLLHSVARMLRSAKPSWLRFGRELSGDELLASLARNPAAAGED
jgi:hypothetical protein